MRIRKSILLWGIGLPILAISIATKTHENLPEFVQTAAADQVAAVSHFEESELFGPTLKTSNQTISDVLAMKQRGEDLRVAEIYARLTEAGRPPVNPLDQGGENIASATPIPSLPYSDSGTTLGFFNDYDAPCPAGTAPDVVYAYTPTEQHFVTVSLCGSNYDTKLFILQNSQFVIYACNDDACGLASEITVELAFGSTYYIVVDGWNVSSGDYELNVFEPQPCSVPCPPLAVRECEQEAPAPNHGKKDCNGGCNNLTDLGVNLDRFGGICAGQPVCGTCFTYVNDLGNNSRDTDWFLFDVTLAGPVQFQVTAEFNVLLGIVNLNNCIGPTFAASSTTTPCVPGLVNANLTPGRYAAFVAPSAFTGLPEPTGYVAQIFYPTLPPICPCPVSELEPNNDRGRATLIPAPGVAVCGEISCPMDADYYAFHVPSSSALRVHLRGDAATGSCPGGQGLHPYCDIITEDGREIALCGDQTNQATWFDSDFKFGPYTYYFHVGGADYTTGPYEIEIELLQLDLVSCNPITVTIQPENQGVRLRWQGGLLPSDLVRIEYRTDTNLPFQSLADVPPVPANFFDPGSEPFDFREYQLRVIGGREPELSVPWVGSNLGLGESAGPDGEYDEVGNFAVQQIEWAAGPDNVAIQTLLVAHGVGGSTGDALVQDRRDLYTQGYQPIASFAGHWLQVDDRKVLVEHVAFHRDPETGDVGVIDGRGLNETMDTIMYFGNQRVFLEPNNGGVTGLSLSWLWWDWWEDFFCPSFCCRLKSIAFCTSTGAGAPPACTSPPLTRCPCNPACWLGCPCDPPVPPDPAFCCPPIGPPAPSYPTGCSGCTFVPLVGSTFRVIYCQCAAEPSPPMTGRCFFMIFVKCKTYCPCPDLFNICGCAVGVCPGPATWTLVPFVGSAMRAACKSECVIGGPGC